jgi:hypothetical protein
LRERRRAARKREDKKEQERNEEERQAKATWNLVYQSLEHLCPPWLRGAELWETSGGGRGQEATGGQSSLARRGDDAGASRALFTKEPQQQEQSGMTSSCFSFAF